ncbi:MAG: S24 family peptidase [Saprospiraceae bacterium]|nr:S24 family peptidase [Saprospiraceae bacterium]
MSDFSDNTVNQRFKAIFERLSLEGKVKSKSDIASQLGTYNHVINSILKGKRNITLDQTNKLVEIYGINANYLFGASSQMFADEASPVPTLSITEKIMEGRNNITLVPQKAMAGYAVGVENPTFTDYMDQFKRFSVPGLEGDLIAFEISGDSMLPNITDGDIVICEPLAREGNDVRIKNNAIYVIVRDDIVAKRIQEVRDNGNLEALRLISDNAQFYPPYKVGLDEVKQILRVKYRLTAHGIA